MIDDRDSIATEHQTMIGDLTAKSGTEFDKAYMEMMIIDHEKAIELFNGVSNNTSGTIQAFAAKTLTTLHKHLDSAKKISENLK